MAIENPTTDDLLKSELLRLDVILRKKQAWWETPRNFAVLLGVFAAVVGAGGGFVGYRLASSPPTSIIVQFGDRPLHVHLDQDKQP